MDLSQRTGAFEHLLEVTVALGDLFAQGTDPVEALHAGFEFALMAAGEPGGVLAIMNAEDHVPHKIIVCHPKDEWVSPIDPSNAEFFGHFREELLHSGQGWVDEDNKLRIFPLPSTYGNEGYWLCASEEPEKYSTELIRTLSPVFGRAIHRYRSNNTFSHQQIAMTALNIMASALESRQSSSETQLMMVKSICKILKAEQGMLVILDEDQNEFAIVTIYDTLKEQVHQESRPIEEGLVVTCIRDSRIILVNKVTGDEGLNLRFDVPNATPVRSLLCCPLNASNNSLGAILVFNQEQGGFSQLDRELMASMASALANTAFNLRLIQQLKLANADLEASRWELLRSRNTLRALFDNIPSSFYIIDRHYGLIAINMSRADRANSKPNLMVGRKCHQVLYGRAEPCPGCKVADTLFGGHATSRVDRSWIANDQFMEWEINTYPIYDVANQPVQAILVEQDITEKRRLEVSLAQSEKLAAVGQLAAGVAHEINNPLAAIIANAQILARDLPKDDDLQESVKLIQMAGSRASQVVRNLLGLARKENYEFLPVDLNDTIRNSLMLLQHEFVSRPVDLIFDLADDLPRIIASRDHLQGVWINLMLNAFDALEGAPGEVRITTRKQGNEFRITIADTGKGIPPDKVSRIFEPFYTTKEAGRGTGLGLSLCHRIIKQHGGYILVESQVGAGTKFIVVLPGTSEPSS